MFSIIKKFFIGKKSSINFKSLPLEQYIEIHNKYDLLYYISSLPYDVSMNDIMAKGKELNLNDEDIVDIIKEYFRIK